MQKPFKITVLTGGPSLERGVSLNSARSVMDHLESDRVEIVPIYFDHHKRAYRISRAQLYSNNPSDFDFKLSEHAAPLTDKSLVQLLKSADIAFPAMHGPFGEDGELQSFLEKNRIPFVGSSAEACKVAFDKYEANQAITKAGFFTLPSAVLKIYDKNNSKIIKDFFTQNKIKRAIVKPATGGSSIGAFSVTSPTEANKKAEVIFSKRIDTRVVIEPFAIGKEFTVIILQNRFGLPVAVMPTEIELAYHEGRIFDYRRKYLPTNQVKYHCPPRWGDEITHQIRIGAKQLFSFFGMKDFARFDGWIMPDGKIWFSDFNPISGMEQNSFLFQQASRVGMSHRDVLQYVVKNSCERQGIPFPKPAKVVRGERKPVSVIFGGNTSEKQTSLMSGTNVWLKLRKSKIYEPKPYLLDLNSRVWKLPYGLILNHTVEEIIENTERAKMDQVKNRKLIDFAKAELKLEPHEASEPFFLPRKMTLAQFIDESKFIFLGLHGGDGENGNIQKLLAKHRIKFNGSGEGVSKLCMDKFETGEYIRTLKIDGVGTAEQKIVKLTEFKSGSAKVHWRDLCRALSSKTLIVKPRADGCSTGIAHLTNYKDLEHYVKFAKKNAVCIPPATLSKHSELIEMPSEKINELLFEGFVETDYVRIAGNHLKYNRKSGWVEVTIGLLEETGKLHAFNPSITIAEGEVLSLEEKFQGGTGVNLTPPPRAIVKKKAVVRARKLTEELAQKIGLKGYARIDAFMNVTTGNLIIIEVNTLPGLTPATVYYHQALAEEPPIYPVELLEKIIQNAGY